MGKFAIIGEVALLSKQSIINDIMREPQAIQILPKGSRAPSRWNRQRKYRDPFKMEPPTGINPIEN
jgi:hypothetical protein